MQQSILFSLQNLLPAANPIIANYQPSLLMGTLLILKRISEKEEIYILPQERQNQTHHSWL